MTSEANVGKRESSDGQNTFTLYLGIGNSDDKLTQREWSQFVSNLDHTVRRHADQVYGWWFSLPDAPWQNATVGLLINARNLEPLRADVQALREHFRQDSVAWTLAPTVEFV